MADIIQNGQPEPAVPLPPQKPTKPKQHKALSKDGPKVRHRSTRAELDREKMTAKVITCLLTGKTIDETAEELDLSIAWVRRVRAELSEDLVAQLTQAKTNEISQLIEQGLKTQLIAMIKIVEVTNDELWLKAQRAPELATFFGVINDKTVRVLAAIERADERARLERETLSLPGTVVSEQPTFRREKQTATQGT